jgi:hypothetical protein
MRSLLLREDIDDELDCTVLETEFVLDTLSELALLVLVTELDELEKLDEVVAGIDDTEGGLVLPEPPPHPLNNTKNPHTEANRTHTQPLIPIAIPHLKIISRLI